MIPLSTYCLSLAWKHFSHISGHYMPPLITEGDLTLAEAGPPSLYCGGSHPHPRAESLGWISRQKRKWCGLPRAAWHAEGALGSIILQHVD